MNTHNNVLAIEAVAPPFVIEVAYFLYSPAVRAGHIMAKSSSVAGIVSC